MPTLVFACFLGGRLFCPVHVFWGLCALVPFVCSGIIGSGDGQLFWVVMVARGMLGGIVGKESLVVFMAGGVWLVWGDGCVHFDTPVIDTENWVCLVVGLQRLVSGSSYIERANPVGRWFSYSYYNYSRMSRNASSRM